MKTFYLIFQLIPTFENKQYEFIQGALAHCWIVDDDLQSAYAKAKFFVSKDDWEIEKEDTFPIEVKDEHFLERDLGLERFRKAQKDGIAICYTALARDDKAITELTILPISPSYRFNLNDYVKKQKNLARNGRCLHYDKGYRCDKIISAHSIQKNQSLSAIAVDGHVYAVSQDIGDFKIDKRNFIYKKYGIKNISTFPGFCKKHDNELFEPIDNSKLLPTDQQVFLYAYRSLCRELFIKENAFDLVDSQLNNSIPDKHAIKQLLDDVKISTNFGLENLKIHKLQYDSSLRKELYTDIKYVLFISKQQPCVAFSGLLYPEFDFMGNPLQNLGDHKSSLQLITICSSPMAKNGWGFLLAWHQSSSNVCVDFMRSLATIVHGNQNLGDCLFRMVVSSCENLAISPKWWDELPKHHKEQISSRVSSMADIFSMTKHDYLVKGLEGIVQWSFEYVISNME